MTREHSRKELGTQGEWWAAEFYQNQGATLLAHSARNSYGEIDLICEKLISETPHRKYQCIFVEVKTRESCRYGTGIETVTEEKLGRIYRAAAQWLNQEAERFYEECRFDVILLRKNKQGELELQDIYEGVEL